MEYLKVIGVEITNRGTTIKFNSIENVVIDSKLSITLDREHFFEVSKITIEEDNILHVEAIEIGYYSKKFDCDKNLILSRIMRLEISFITDKDKIAKINKSSRLC